MKQACRTMHKQGKRFVKAESYKPVKLIHWSPTASQAAVAAVVTKFQQRMAAWDGAFDHAAKLPHGPG